MSQDAVTLSDLVDFSLKLPGFVNFNKLRTVLLTLLKVLKLEDFRPFSDKLDHPRQDQFAQAKARLLEKPRSHDSIAPEKRESEDLQPEATKSPSSLSEEETSSLSPTGEEKEDADKKTTHKEDKDYRQEPTADEEPPSNATSPVLVAQNVKYSALEYRVVGVEEGFTSFSEILDTIVDRIQKLESKAGSNDVSSPEGLEELKQRVEKLEQNLTEPKKKSNGASSEELEELEDRIEALEEAKVVFDQDHVTLEEVLKVQKEILQEFTEIKALGNEIKNMKKDITLKADAKEMEESLDLKADLSLVLEKVDQLYFETAIEELGEAIGTLGIKFVNKNTEWKEQCGEMRREVDSKMSREVFDEAVSEIGSRITALMHALYAVKRVVEELLYPDSSGVTKCILCRRPATISGHECVEMKNNSKRPHKSSKGSSDDSVCMENFMKNVDNVMAKKSKADGPSFAMQRDTTIKIPYCSSTYRTGKDDKVPMKGPELKLAPVSNNDDQTIKRKSKAPKFLTKRGPRESNSTQKVRFPASKRETGLPHRELVFTHKVLEDYSRGAELQTKDSNSSPGTNSASTPSTEQSKAASETTDVMSDSVRNMDSFAPMRLMPDPLRQEIIRSPNAGDRSTPNLTLAPLYPDSTSRRDSTEP